MSDQELYPVSITEPWPRQRNRWILVALVLGFAATVITIGFDRKRLDPIQQFYLSGYIRSNMPWLTGKQAPYDFLELTSVKGTVLAQPGDAIVDIESPNGLAVSPDAEARGVTAIVKIHRSRALTERIRPFLKSYIYRDRSLRGIFPLTTIALALVVLSLFVGASADYNYRRQLLKGLVRRGPRLVDTYTFNVALLGITWKEFFLRRPPSVGVSFATRLGGSINEWLDPRYPRQIRGRLAISPRSENSHIALMGASGTGKSVLLRQFLRQIQQRGDAAIVYDPAGEFTAEFYNEARGDTILNPLDQRCPYWTPAGELATNTEALTLAESLFPDTNAQNQFFVQAPRKIFAHLLQYEPDPETLAAWLSLPDEIDLRVAGTEMAQMLGKAAGAQRMGVLASLGMIADSFRLLPSEAQATRPVGTVGRWTARKWAETRQGWVFLTSTTTTRTIQRPLQSMWLDTMILRLMRTSPDRITRPVWLVLDELASLQKLPQLETALTEARKYQIKVIIGFQGQSQLQERYGDKGAETILGQAKTKVYLRTNEPNAAEWISKALGEQEVERVRETRSLQDGLQSRNSQSYARELRNERAVTTAQILGSEDLHGWIKQENYVAHFVLPVVKAVNRVPSLIEREQAIFTPFTLVANTSPDASTATDDPSPASAHWHL